MLYDVGLEVDVGVFEVQSKDSYIFDGVLKIVV